MTSSVKDELEKALDGQVRFDSLTRKIYSVDASIFEIEPIGIVIPKHREDIIQTVKIAKKHHIPLIPRGAATGITGGCIGKGLIIDTSKYCNRIIDINYDEETATVEPGVVQDRLNEALEEKGYCLGPETSTGNRATIGGMVANNAAGTRSLLYGKMVDHVVSVEMVLASGEVFEFGDGPPQIKRKILEIKEKYAESIKKMPDIPRRVSGYNLDSINLAKLITGSEGTLGMITKIKVKISKKPQNVGQCLIFFDEAMQGFKAVPELLKHNLISLEMIDDKIIEMGSKSPSMRGQLDWLVKKPKAIFIAEMTGEVITDRLNAFEEHLRKEKIGFHHLSLTDKDTMQSVRNLRKAGLGLLLSKRSYNRAVAFIEDLSVPPHQLAPFMEKFERYLQEKNKTAGIYGHVGSGCMHLRPYMDLRNSDEVELMQEMMQEITVIVLEHGGVMSGEHGDGLIRSWLNEKQFGHLYQAFVEVKQAFDPTDLMNPGKIVNSAFQKENLRKAPQTNLETFLNFDKEGGFELAVDLCNGNGQCRKKEGLMCPSFQATQDEYDSTRARAQSLRAMTQGEMPIGKEVMDVLDLCLECKGCKTECPSQVDMAKMKAEFLYQYQNQSLRDKLLANISFIYEKSAHFPRLFNLFSRFKWIKSLLGISTERQIPPLAHCRFSKWFQSYQQPKLDKKVVLFNDTFTEFTSPHIGQAAVKVLNSLGYNVILPKWKCCGRPLISKGFLEQAKIQAEALVKTLLPYSHLPIIGLEPSCILTVKDDFPSMTDTFDLKFITFDEFIHKHIQRGELPLKWKGQSRMIKVHGHCHQKALVGMRPTMEILKVIPGFHATEIPSGCCGMAGSFGYEAEHVEISRKIGELQLLPEVRSSAKDTIIVANGISCRSQISSETSMKAKHLAEVLNEALRDNS